MSHLSGILMGCKPDRQPLSRLYRPLGDRRGPCPSHRFHPPPDAGTGQVHHIQLNFTIQWDWGGILLIIPRGGKRPVRQCVCVAEVMKGILVLWSYSLLIVPGGFGLLVIGRKSG